MSILLAIAIGVVLAALLILYVKGDEIAIRIALWEGVTQFRWEAVGKKKAMVVWASPRGAEVHTIWGGTFESLKSFLAKHAKREIRLRNGEEYIYSPKTD